MPQVVAIKPLDEFTEDEIKEYGIEREEYKNDGAEGAAILEGEDGYHTVIPIRKSEDGGTSVDEEVLYWEWINPAAPIEKASLSPSIVREVDGEVLFHGHIEGGKWNPA